MANINDFKARLAGGGARANQFRVILPPPVGVVTAAINTEQFSFLCKATSLPGQELTEIAVPFRGRNLYVAGEREFAEWTTTVFNDTDFSIRREMERWLNGINNMSDNEGLTNPTDYQVDAFVDHLDRNGNTIKSYTFRGMYPQALQAIDLNYDAATAVEEFVCTWRYQYWESNTTT